MRTNLVVLFLICFVALCNAVPEPQGELEVRGKKKKIAYFVYFADIIVKKFFVLKLIYAFVFWLVIHKAGYFLSWFVSYLKEKKQEYHVHGHDHYGPHHYDHGPSYGPGPSYSSGPSFGPAYIPYRRKNN